MSRFTEDQIEHLRDRFTQLTQELNDVFDEIALRVQALSEELDEGDQTSGADAAQAALGHVHRPARG